MTTAPILPAAGAPDLLAGILAATPPANTAPAAAPSQPSQQDVFNTWFASLTPEMQAQVRASMSGQTAPAIVEAPQTTATQPVVIETPAPPTIVIPETKPVAPPVETPTASRGRGRPPKSETLELLKACAMGGLKAADAREYIALAGEQAA